MTDIRDRWPSRTLFIFAAIGSSVGLGNIWRFPFLVGKYGGGAFLLPYLVEIKAFEVLAVRTDVHCWSHPRSIL